MRILITGAAGSVGRGLVGRLRAEHDLVLTDLVRPAWVDEAGFEFHQLDIQVGVGLERAARGCDLIVHTPAWHGIHWQERTEVDFWRLNVDGTFWALQAARAAGVKRFLYLSSLSWHNHYDKYGFTKRIGEELLEYQHRSGLSYVAVRPADFTPWRGDWPQNYGARLLYGGVDREDVLDAVALSVARLAGDEQLRLIVDATRRNAFTEADVERWVENPAEVAESLFPGAATVIARFGLDVSHQPRMVSSTGWEEIGYRPSRHFGTFVERALQMTDGEVAALSSAG